MLPLTKTLTLFTVSLALFMDVPTPTSSTPPSAMSRSFQVNPVDLKIALISYLLSLAIFIPISGWAADHYGAKRIFLCPRPLHLHLLLVRLRPHLARISDRPQHPRHRRRLELFPQPFNDCPHLQKTRASRSHERRGDCGFGCRSCLGPLIGGVITDHLSWPWIFWVNIPAGLIAMLLTAFTFKDLAPRQNPPSGFLGFYFIRRQLPPCFVFLYPN